MSEPAVELTVAGKERLARLQRVLDRFQTETRCVSPEFEQLRRALRRHIEKHCAASAPGTDAGGAARCRWMFRI